MNAKKLGERLIDAERRAAVAEHEAAVYRNQVCALVRELQRAKGTPEDQLVQAGRAFLVIEDDADA